MTENQHRFKQLYIDNILDGTGEMGEELLKLFDVVLAEFDDDPEKMSTFIQSIIDEHTPQEPNELEKLKQEKEQLINVERPKVIEELQLARSQGDLSENADYDAARDKQAHIEARIKEIDQMLLHVQIIDESQLDSTVAKPGATVTILDLSEADAQEETFTIVGTFETDPLNGKISNESPLAKAILDHGINEIVSVGVAEPYEVKILKIEYMD